MTVQDWPRPQGLGLRVVFPGRFQPFHPGHYAGWRWLCARFGEQSVWLCTSDKAEDGSGRYPLRFVEKRDWISGLYDIPPQRVVLETNPYKPLNIPDGADPAQTLFIAAVSDKDRSRLKGPYFEPLPEQGFEPKPRPMQVGGYVVVVPGLAQVSGTQIREALRDPRLSPAQRQDWLEQVYGTQRPELLQLLLRRV